MIPRLGDDPTSPFPPVTDALESPDGLLAWGGSLVPDRLRRAYRAGVFPWYSDDDPILWWSPAQRCVFDTDGIHVSRSLGRVLRQDRYRVTADRNFSAVIEGCARDREDTWITADMRTAYQEMYRLGHGHSIEVWAGDELVGGLYGLAFGRMFFGESMYSARRDASKVALVSLCRVLQQWAMPWLDCQVPNEHLLKMGARMVPRAEFLQGVRRLVDEPAPTGSWTDDFEATLAAP